MTLAGSRRVRAVAIAAGAALLVAILGGLVTNIGPWYQSLERPDWQPPDWLFAPVWTAIYALTAIAGVLSWWASDTSTQRWNLLLALSSNAFLNVMWSLLFFRMQRPDWALGEVLFLWASTLALVVVCARRRPLAGWLVMPYLAWVTFAAILNAKTVELNAPFGP